MKWLLILLTLFPGFMNNPPVKMSFAVGKESSVTITGSSNVNHFRFKSPSYQSMDTLVLIRNEKQDKIQFGKGLLRMPVKNFRNGNPMLTKDFKKILKEKEFPFILMSFRTVTALPVSNNVQEADAEVDISLAGKTITRCIKLRTSRVDDVIYLSGKECLKFSDFGLKAPSNVMGFIDVKDDLDVDFRLELHVVR
jgi:hypothetical protein